MVQKTTGLARDLPKTVPPKSMQAMSASVQLEREVLLDPPAPLLPPLSDPSLYSQTMPTHPHQCLLSARDCSQCCTVLSCDDAAELQQAAGCLGMGQGGKDKEGERGAWEEGEEYGIGNERLLSHGTAADCTILSKEALSAKHDGLVEALSAVTSPKGRGKWMHAAEQGVHIKSRH